MADAKPIEDEESDSFDDDDAVVVKDLPGKKD